jgi:hypothetical protein
LLSRKQRVELKFENQELKVEKEIEKEEEV